MRSGLGSPGILKPNSAASAIPSHSRPPERILIVSHCTANLLRPSPASEHLPPVAGFLTSRAIFTLSLLAFALDLQVPASDGHGYQAVGNYFGRPERDVY
jgi:hypothetical protein